MTAALIIEWMSVVRKNLKNTMKKRKLPSTIHFFAVYFFFVGFLSSVSWPTFQSMGQRPPVWSAWRTRSVSSVLRPTS